LEQAGKQAARLGRKQLCGLLVWTDRSWRNEKNRVAGEFGQRLGTLPQFRHRSQEARTMHLR